MSNNIHIMIQENRLIRKYLPVDYKDCFSQTMVDKPYMSVKDLFNLIFRQYPQWILWLLKLRDIIVKPFGLKTNKSFEDIILST